MIRSVALPLHQDFSDCGIAVLSHLLLQDTLRLFSSTEILIVLRQCRSIGRRVRTELKLADMKYVMDSSTSRKIKLVSDGADLLENPEWTIEAW